MKQQRIQMRAHKEMRGLEYLIYSTFSLCLLLVLVLLPLAPVFADEVVPEHTESVVETSSEEENLVTQESVTAVHESADEVETTEVIDIEGDLDAVEGVEISHGSLLLSTQATETTMDVQDEVLVHDVASGNTETHLSEATTTAPTVAHTMSDPVVSDIPLHNEEVLSSTTDIVANDSTNATSTAMAIPEVPLQDVPVRDEVVSTTSEATTSAQNIENVDNVVNVVTNNDNKFSFSKDECTTIGDGTFYCANASLLPEVIHTDRVFSAVDTDGDKEIYVEKAGMLTTLTDNAVDDDAPYFDEVSNTAVWHRLIDGRYQIMEYNFDDETETQVTNDSFNNMQPSVFGDALVWQGWIGNDWEIFLEREGDTKMLTDNTTHDIAPSVNGTHIVWQSFENETWQMKVYDIRTGLIDTIEDSGGGSIENPRFVLVYDAKMETGDIETRGYDLKSGEVVDLASKPMPVPEEIPDPDQTGEKRALVTPSTQPKQKTDSDENDDIGTTTPTGTGDGDLVIPALGETVTEALIDTSTSTTHATQDVVIPVYETGSSTPSIDHIEDLVVEAYVASSSIPTESQNLVVGE